MTTPDRPVEGLVEVTAACVVLDIEGTTSPTRLRPRRLYDYARPRLGPVDRAHGDDPDVGPRRRRQGADAGGPRATPAPATVVAAPARVDGRRRQGHSAEDAAGPDLAGGYAAGELTSRFFPDVVPALRAWHGPASASPCSPRARWPASGLVPAPRRRPRRRCRRYFDTVNAGPKREAALLPTRSPPASGAEHSPATGVLLRRAGRAGRRRRAGWRAVGGPAPGEPNAERRLRRPDRRASVWASSSRPAAAA